MECNKDEATRAKEIAEKKLTEMDVAGAKKFAFKAQKLYPQLDGLSGLLAVIHVYGSAEKRVSGEVDWYAIIGVDPSADDATIRKHYKHMALALHPDKNKSVGADGAFKILSQAWSLMSNKLQKFAYDQKRNINGISEKMAARNPSVPATRNVYSSSRSSTFWTFCPFCLMHYEYALLYLGSELQCQECRCNFRGIQTQPPEGKRTPWSDVSVGAGNVTLPSFSFSKVDGIYRPSREQMERMLDEIQIATLRQDALQRKTTGAGLQTGESSKSTLKGDKPKKRKRVKEHKLNVDRIQKMKQKFSGFGRFGMGSVYGAHNGSFDAGKVNWVIPSMPIPRELSLPDVRKMLTHKALAVIKTNVNNWKVDVSSIAAGKSGNPYQEAKVKVVKEKSKAAEEKKMVKATENGAKVDAKYVKPVDYMKTVKTEKLLSPRNLSAGFDTNNNSRLKLMSVPDSDFHDFDNDRTEKSFGSNQVWAAYDDDDGMPRYYALIHKVISIKPFKIKVSWLNTKSNDELGPLNWLGSGFYKTCGDFRVGKHKVEDCLNSFSHKVKWSKGPKGAIQIYPVKGDVWAFYKNWSPDWDAFTPEDVIHKYYMVEVLEDFNENGILVAPLLKLAGFKTVFRRHPATTEAMRIPKDEMFKFSHQVPSCKLTGQEGLNAPADCWEIDPAAAPLELLQVIVDEQEVGRMAENAGKNAEAGADM